MKDQLALKKRSVWWYFPRALAILLLIVGIITAALNVTFGGFTPIMWFLLAIADLIIVTCNETLRIADFLERKK